MTNPSIITLKQSLLWKFPVSQHALAPFLICDIKKSLQYADIVNILKGFFLVEFLSSTTYGLHLLSKWSQKQLWRNKVDIQSHKINNQIVPARVFDAVVTAIPDSFQVQIKLTLLLKPLCAKLPFLLTEEVSSNAQIFPLWQYSLTDV